MKRSRKPREYLQTKSKKQVVDYFPRGGAGGKEDFTYNTAMIKTDPNKIGHMLKKKTVRKEKTKLDEDFNEDVVMESTLGKEGSRALLPKFKVGDLVLLSISEIRKDYMIANYTRNKKAMIHSSYSGLENSDQDDFSFEKYFKVGQFISGAVVSPGNDIQLPGGKINKKILVSIDPKIINTGLTLGSLVVGMDLYGKLIKTKDEVYHADFKLSSTNNYNTFNEDEDDESEDNYEDGQDLSDAGEDLDFDQDEEQELDDEEENVNQNEISNKRKNKHDYKHNKYTNADFTFNLVDNEESPEIFSDKIVDSYYYFKIININKDSNGVQINISLNNTKYKFPIKEIDYKYLRPGFLFKSNTTRELVNGCEVAFGGNIATVFSDHIKSKKKAKGVLSRVIHLSLDKKATSLSTLSHIINLHVEDAETKKGYVGKVYKGIVAETLFGNSYNITLEAKETGNDNFSVPVSAFLHNSQLDNREETFNTGNVIETVLVKEYNYFDDKPLLTSRKDAIDSGLTGWDNLNVGRIVTGRIKEILSDCMLVAINNYIEGRIPKEHITDYPLNKIPKKFQVGNEVKARIFTSDYSKKNLTLTMKESLLDPDVKLVDDISMLNEGEEIYVTYVGNGLFQHSGKVLAKLMNFNKQKEKFTIGKLYNFKIYKMNLVTKKIFLTDQVEVWQPGVGDFESHLKRNPILSSIALLLNKNESSLVDGSIANFEVIPVKKLVKFLLKKGLDQNLIKENSEALTERFLVARTLIESNQKYSYAFIPKDLVSDYYKEKIFKLYSTDVTEGCEMLVLYSNNGVSFVTPKKSLIDNREIIANSESTLLQDHVYCGYVNKKNSKGVVVQFLGKKKIQVRIKEEEMNHSFDQGSTVLVKFQAKRFILDIDLKNADEESQRCIANYLHDLATLTKYDKNVKAVLDEVKVNSILEGNVAMIKEYGVLVHIHPKVTGFLRNEHIKSEAKLTVGDKRKFRVIEVDPVDSIAYLTDDINITLSNSNKIDLTTEERLVLEIFHESHITASLESNPEIKAYVPCNLYNFQYESSQLSDLFKIGDVITSKFTNIAEDGVHIASFPPKLIKKISGAEKKKKTANVISVGSTISGVINGMKGNYIFVYIDKTTLGKLHINHYNGDLEKIKSNLKSTKALNASESLSSSSHNELKIKCKIISIELKDDVKICELTKPDQLSDVSLSKEIDQSGNKPNIGLISQVNVNNKFPIKIESQTQRHQIHYSLIPLDKISTDGLNYKVGEKVEFYSFKTKVNNDEEEVTISSLVPLQSIQSSVTVGSNFPVRVLKSISGRGLVVDITILPFKHIEAFVDICEVTDFLHPCPLKLYPKGQILPGRVLNIDTKSNKYMVSLRNSITNPELYNVITNGSTLKFKQTFEEFERICDMRNKILKFGTDTVIEPNLVAIGYITSSSEKGVFIKLAHDLIVRASLRELTDDKTSKPFLLFKPDTLVICRVTSVYKKDPEIPAKINVSLRESVVKFNMTLKMKDLNQNNFYDCIVMNESDGKYEVTVVGSTFTGIIKRKNMKKDTHFEPKQQVVLHLVKLDKNCHPPKLRFSNLLVDNVDKSLVINSLSDKEIELSQTYVELYNNIKTINQSMKEKEAESQMREINEADIDFEALLEKKQQEEHDIVEEKEDEEDEELIDLEEDEDLIMPETNNILFDYKSKAKLLSNQMEVDDDYNEEEQVSSLNNMPQSTQAHSSRQREKDHLREEIHIRQVEEKEQDEKNAEYYEKLILSDPDKSLHWIQYASYILEKLNLQAARKIFERAITSIDIAKTKEKLNVWIAYMNLENCYGTLETFKSVVERALEVNEKKIIYRHLINIYKMSNKYDLAHEVFKLSLKNYFSDFDLWKSYLEFLFQMQHHESKNKIKDLLEPKEGLNKALQVLPKKRHVDLLLVFGQLQYSNQMYEEARNTFESILKNMPKRSDIWLVYIDKEIKYSKNSNKIRLIFDKMFKVDFKLKTLKTIIKKYLEFEKEHGDVMSLEAAKALTQRIIADRLNALKADEEDEADENEEM